VANQIAKITATDGSYSLDIEHPTGYFTVDLEVEALDGEAVVRRSALLRTARLLMRGEVLIPHSIWGGR
jgi:4-oxalomesaconate tautomerase